jgi:hypothetical protein
MTDNDKEEKGEGRGRGGRVSPEAKNLSYL